MFIISFFQPARNAFLTEGRGPARKTPAYIRGGSGLIFLIVFFQRQNRFGQLFRADCIRRIPDVLDPRNAFHRARQVFGADLQVGKRCFKMLGQRIADAGPPTATAVFPSCRQISGMRS